jgi:hypothetical protein
VWSSEVGGRVGLFRCPDPVRADFEFRDFETVGLGGQISDR